MTEKKCCLLAYYNKEEANYKCQLYKCRNFIKCNEMIPMCVLKSENNLCIDCNVMMGKHTVSDIEKECPVCLTTKAMLILKCNHNICNNCWYSITVIGYDSDNEDNIYNPLCPLCRNYNDWTI